MKLHKYGWLPGSPTHRVALYAASTLHQGVVGEDKWEKVFIFGLFTEAFSNYDHLA